MTKNSSHVGVDTSVIVRIAERSLVGYVRLSSQEDSIFHRSTFIDKIELVSSWCQSPH